MKEEIESTLVFSFFIFWTFCFLNGFFNPYLVTNKTLFFVVEFVFWTIYPIANILYLSLYRNAFAFQEIGFKIRLFNKNNLFLLVGFSLIFTYLVI